MPFTEQPTFEDLIRAINDFAKEHSSTPDVFFEILFGTRPLQAAIVKDAKNTDHCFIAFNNNSDTTNIARDMNRDIKSLLAEFVCEAEDPNYRTPPNIFSDSSLKAACSKLFPPNSIPSRFLVESIKDEKLRQIIQSDKQSTSPTPSALKHAHLTLALELYPHCSIPIKYLLAFLKSSKANTAMQRIKNDEKIWHAYNAQALKFYFETDVLSLDDLYDFGNVAQMIAYKELFDKLNNIPHSFGIDTYYCDVIEHALLKLNGIKEEPKDGCKFGVNHEPNTYYGFKRDITFKFAISADAAFMLVENINKECPGSAVDIPAKDGLRVINVSMAFLQQYFVPQLKEFLLGNRSFIDKMLSDTKRMKAEQNQQQMNALAERLGRKQRERDKEELQKDWDRRIQNAQSTQPAITTYFNDRHPRPQLQQLSAQPTQNMQAAVASQTAPEQQDQDANTSQTTTLLEAAVVTAGVVGMAIFAYRKFKQS